MTLLVLGAGGQVGRALIERAGAAGRGFDRAASTSVTKRASREPCRHRRYPPSSIVRPTPPSTAPKARRSAPSR